MWTPALAQGYRSEWFRADVLAGLTAAAVVIPKAMAYATIAGLPLQVGLYTAFVPMAIYAVLGTSRPLSVSTTTTIAILTAAALGDTAPKADAAGLIAAAGTLSLMVGAMLLFACAIRLGFVANFISEPVLTGFKTGIAIVIVVDQVPKLLGIHFHKGGFFHNVLAIIGELPHLSVATVILAVAILALIYGLEHFTPRAPAPLIAVAAGIAASALLGLPNSGVETVGAIPQALPGLVLPRMDLVHALWPAAVGIALMSFTESIAAARAFSDPNEPRPAPNQELFALGVANGIGGLFGAMPSGGGTTQTAVNRRAGARTQVAELVTAAAAVATLLLLAPVIALMPQAVLAAVVVAYSVELIQPAQFAHIRRIRNAEFIWALIAAAGVVLLGTLKGILVAVIASIVALAYQASHPPVYVVARKRGTAVFRRQSAEHADDESWPGLLILRTEGRIFFLNAASMGEKMQGVIHEAKPRVVLLDFSAVFDLEYTALKMLTEAEDRLRRDGITLWLAALNPSVLEMVNRSPLGAALGRERLFFNLEAAVAKFQAGA